MAKKAVCRLCKKKRVVYALGFNKTPFCLKCSADLLLALDRLRYPEKTFTPMQRPQWAKDRKD